MKSRPRLILPLLLSLGLLAGCSVGGGMTQEKIIPTLGQELIDLKHARDSGSISQEEYVRLKQRLMQSR